MTLTNPANTLGGAVSVGGNNVAITVTGPLTLGTDTATGNLTVNSTGALNLGTSTVGGNLVANSGNGNITQTGALSVTGTTGIAAGTGNVMLAYAGNNLAGVVSISGDNVTLVDGAGLVLGNVTTEGTLNATSKNSITQAAGTDIVTTGMANFTSTTGSVTLATSGNSFKGGVNLSSSSATTVVTPVQATAALPVAANNPPSLQLPSSTAVTVGNSGATASVGSTASSASSSLTSTTTVSPTSSQSSQSTEAASGQSTVASTGSAGGGGSVNSAAPVSTSQASAGAESASSSSSSSGTTGTAGAAGGSDISVSLIRPTSVAQSGIVAVSVPKDMATAGSGFSFPLPAQVASTAGNNVVSVSTASGQPLPTWLKFNPESKTFVASAVPDGAFPMQVVVTVGGTSTTIVISERAQ